MVRVSVGPWPWSLFSVVAGVVFVLAIVAAWRSADRVVPENRAWTRAWRIVVAFAGFSVNGIALPVGAVFILARYGRALRPRRSAAPA